MLDERGLDLGGGQSVAGNVDNIVDTATDPVVALVVTASTISGELVPVSLIALILCVDTHVVALVHVQVSVHVPLVGSPDSAGHAGPRLLEGKTPSTSLPWISSPETGSMIAGSIPKKGNEA